MISLHAHVSESASRQVRGPVLLADDDFELREVIADVLRTDGYQVLEAGNGPDLIKLIATKLDDDPVRRRGLVISDNRMPGASGLDVLADLRAHSRSTHFVLITAFGDAETAAEAYRLDAQIVLDKPINLGDLRTVAWLLLGH